MKKFFALLLALTMVLSLAACGAKEETPAEKPAEGTEAPAEAPADALPGEGMKIALVCDKVGTQVFLLQMVDALNEAAEKYGFEATVAECADNAAFEENIRALVAEEYDLIIGGGCGGMQAAITAAERPSLTETFRPRPMISITSWPRCFREGPKSNLVTISVR